MIDGAPEDRKAQMHVEGIPPPDEMLEGYFDGFDPDSPEPSANRSASYRHGFANGRDDRNRSPRAPAAALRIEARDARERDREQFGFTSPEQDHAAFLAEPEEGE